jgi:prephenate dehydrogenase
MGTSVGLSLRAFPSHVHVVGWDTDPDALAVAFRRGGISEPAASLAEAVSSADLVVIAAPIEHVVPLARAIGPHLKDEAVVTDVASAKASLVPACEAVLGGRFVGGHPMAGSEISGPATASAEILRDAPWVLTPTPRTSGAAMEAVTSLVRRVGAVPVPLSPEEHDRMAAMLSHLPHAIAFALVSTASSELPECLVKLAAGSYRSATRVSASDPEMWAAIMTHNRDAVLHALDCFVERLAGIRDALARDDMPYLVHILSEGHVDSETPNGN